MRENIIRVLNRTYGYEIAELLLEEELSFSEIKSGIETKLGTQINPNEVNRILKAGLKEGLFVNPPTRRGTKYAVNGEAISLVGRETIQERARSRRTDADDFIDSSGCQSIFLEREIGPPDHTDSSFHANE